MACDEQLVTRVRHLLQVEPGLSEMRGRRMDGWLHVAGEAVEGADDLRRWVSHGLAYARSLSPK